MQKAWAITKNTKGFTIIELLVTIVVIGILITITTVSYNGISQRSRDSERGSDVTQIKIALEKYHAEKGRYPAVCPAVNTGCSIGLLGPELEPYLKAIPHDPKAVADSTGDYRYAHSIVQSDGYGIFVSYEAKPACKTGSKMNSSWWGVSTPTC